MKTKKLTLLTNVLCHEVEIHYKRPIFKKEERIKSSEDINRIIRTFADKKRIDHKEFFWLVLLSNANQVLGIAEISSGTAKGVVVNIAEVFQMIITTNSQSFAVVHNHPSGKLEPSASDRKLTNKLKKASKLFDIVLLDHLIITSESYVSFSDSNWL